MEDIRTLDGVRAEIEEIHRSVRDDLDRAGAIRFNPTAWVWIQRKPETGERLDTPARMKVVTPFGAPLDVLVAAVRKVAMAHGAVGVCLMVPLYLVDELPLDGSSLPPPGPDDMRLAFTVEHMSERIGRPLWTAKVVQQGHSVEIGDLEEEEGGAIPLGSIGSLLPQREMN